MADETPKPQSKRRLWLMLMILPFVGLVAVAILQTIIRFLLASRMDAGSSYVQGPGDVVQTFANIFSMLLGIICVALIVLFPLWLILFLREENGKRTKNIAVLLAVFFGFWSWLYTYERDRTKFWVNLCLSVVTFGYWSIVGWIWAIIDRASKPDEFYLSYTTAGNTPETPAPQA